MPMTNQRTCRFTPNARGRLLERVAEHTQGLEQCAQAKQSSTRRPGSLEPPCRFLRVVSSVQACIEAQQRIPGQTGAEAGLNPLGRRVEGPPDPAIALFSARFAPPVASARCSRSPRPERARIDREAALRGRQRAGRGTRLEMGGLREQVRSRRGTRRRRDAAAAR